MEEKLLQKLTVILKKEHKYYKQLEKLAIRKKDALVENNIEELTKILEEDDGIINEINTLEEDRNSIVLKLANFYQLEEEERVNYSQLLKYIPKKWENKLAGIRENLLDVIDRLHQQNEQNRRLVEEALKLNQVSANMLMSVLEPEDKTYNPRQKKKTDKTTHLIDRKA